MAVSTRIDVGQRPIRDRELVERQARLAARRAGRPFDGGLDVDGARDVGPGGARGQEARERQIVDAESAGDFRGSPIVGAGAVDRAAVEDAAELFDHHARFLFARAEAQQTGSGAGDVALPRPQRRHLAGERPTRLIERAFELALAVEHAAGGHHFGVEERAEIDGFDGEPQLERSRSRPAEHSVEADVPAAGLRIEPLDRERPSIDRGLRFERHRYSRDCDRLTLDARGRPRIAQRAGRRCRSR